MDSIVPLDIQTHSVCVKYSGKSSLDVTLACAHKTRRPVIAPTPIAIVEVWISLACGSSCSAGGGGCVVVACSVRILPAASALLVWGETAEFPSMDKAAWRSIATVDCATWFSFLCMHLNRLQCYQYKHVLCLAVHQHGLMTARTWDHPLRDIVAPLTCAYRRFQAAPQQTRDDIIKMKPFTSKFSILG